MMPINVCQGVKLDSLPADTDRLPTPTGLATLATIAIFRDRAMVFILLTLLSLGL